MSHNPNVAIVLQVELTPSRGRSSVSCHAKRRSRRDCRQNRRGDAGGTQRQWCRRRRPQAAPCRRPHVRAGGAAGGAGCSRDGRHKACRRHRHNRVVGPTGGQAVRRKPFPAGRTEGNQGNGQAHSNRCQATDVVRGSNARPGLGPSAGVCEGPRGAGKADRLNADGRWTGSRGHPRQTGLVAGTPRADEILAGPSAGLLPWGLGPAGCLPPPPSLAAAGLKPPTGEIARRSAAGGDRGQPQTGDASTNRWRGGGKRRRWRFNSRCGTTKYSTLVTRLTA